MAVGSPWGSQGALRGPGSSSGVYGGARDDPEMKGSAPGGLQAHPRNLKSVFWGACGFVLCAQNVENILVSVIATKKNGFYYEAQLDFQEGPGRFQKHVFGALAGSQGALRTSVQVHGGCWGGRLG